MRDSFLLPHNKEINSTLKSRKPRMQREASPVTLCSLFTLEPSVDQQVACPMCRDSIEKFETHHHFQLGRDIGNLKLGRDKGNLLDMLLSYTLKKTWWHLLMVLASGKRTIWDNTKITWKKTMVCFWLWGSTKNNLQAFVFFFTVLRFLQQVDLYMY